MLIGIDASRAFLPERTGIEEYAYRVIEHLQKEISEEMRVVLYVKKFQISNLKYQSQNLKTQNENSKGYEGEGVIGDLKLSKNWEAREIPWRRFWTQGGLAWEMFRRPVDVLFVPAHTVPWIHPKKTVVVVHGLEYEFCPGAYSLWERWYMRVTIWLSCRWAWRIVAVSENTKRDLMRLYGVADEKITVVYEGVSLQMENEKLKMKNGDEGGENFEPEKSRGGPRVAFTGFRISNPKSPVGDFGSPLRDFDSNKNDEISQFLNKENSYPLSVIRFPFLLFIGRIEERKNVVRIVEAFEMLKEKYKIPHMLVLAGKAGYGYQNVKCQMSNVKCRNDIIELGYVSEERKWELLRGADVFVFPSLYEGFGLPILEAQSVGVPVVTSSVSSMPEIAGYPGGIAPTPSVRRRTSPPQAGGEECSAVLVDPYDVESIAEGIYSILLDNKKREQLVSLGYENVKRFSWEKCAKQISNILTNDQPRKSEDAHVAQQPKSKDAHVAQQPTTNNDQEK